MKVAEIAEIIAKHQPAENMSCWANERWCWGCVNNDEIPTRGQSFQIYPQSEFPQHQAEMIKKAQRERKHG